MVEIGTGFVVQGDRTEVQERGALTNTGFRGGRVYLARGSLGFRFWRVFAREFFRDFSRKCRKAIGVGVRG